MTDPAVVLADDLSQDDEPVHAWFELSYSNYQVLHRTLMQSMPVEWQRRMVACLEELRAAFDHVPQASGYEVTPCCWVAPAGMDEDEMRLAGVTRSDPFGGQPAYYDRDGRELDPHMACVPLPAHEPVPHYDRGRARVQPRTEEPT